MNKHIWRKRHKNEKTRVFSRVICGLVENEARNLKIAFAEKINKTDCSAAQHRDDLLNR